jgi:hypothetical protein
MSPPLFREKPTKIIIIIITKKNHEEAKEILCPNSREFRSQ